MTRLQTVRNDALSLSDADRALLAVDLLDTLPPVLSDADEGLSEALSRDRDLDAYPSHAIDFAALKRSVGK